MKSFAMICATVIGSTLFAAPSIEITNVQQQYPWTNTVDITYNVSGVPVRCAYLCAVFEAKTENNETLGVFTNELMTSGTGLTTQWQPPFDIQKRNVRMIPYIYRVTNTPKAYVRDGLVAMWDGEFNAGWDKHNSNSSTWVDLISGWNGTLNAYNTKCARFGSKYMEVYADGFPCVVPRQISDVIATKNFTVEVVVKPSRNSIRCTLFGNWCNGQNYNFEAYANNSLRVYYNARPDLYSANGLYTSGTLQTCSQATTPNSQIIYRNATAVMTRSGTINWSTKPGTDTILGGEMARPTMSARGYHYCFRIYNRALAADEIAYNRTVDVARFGN